MRLPLHYFLLSAFVFVVVGGIVLIIGIACPVKLSISPAKSIDCELSRGWAFGLFRHNKCELVCSVDRKPSGAISMLDDFFEQPIALLPTHDPNRIVCLYDFDVKVAAFTIHLTTPTSSPPMIPDQLKGIVESSSLDITACTTDEIASAKDYITQADKAKLRKNSGHRRSNLLFYLNEASSPSKGQLPPTE